jgi:8-amino-7-oxononanoate synthase
LALTHDAWLLTDDAHDIGVIGGGRGGNHAAGAEALVLLQVGTLSKALGSYGGYLCASRAVCELMRNRARGFIYTTGLPPASASAALAALEIVAREPGHAARPLTLARAFTRQVGLPEAESPIVPLLLGTALAALRAQAALEAEGFLVTAIRSPTVPANTARLRFTFTARHPEEEVMRLAEVVRAQLPTWRQDAA